MRSKYEGSGGGARRDAVFPKSKQNLHQAAGLLQHFAAAKSGDDFLRTTAPLPVRVCLRCSALLELIAPLTRQADGTPVAHFLTPIHRRRQPISIGLPSGWPHAAWMRDECHWGHHFEAHLQKGWVRCYMCFGQTTDGICRW